MQNLKIRVNNADESKEIQNILESKGFKKWEGWSELGSIGGFIWTNSDMTYCDNKIEYFDESPRKEITLPELREMANPMKEYLEKQTDGTLELVLREDLCKDDDIEVPEGMNYAYDAGSFIQFTKQEMGYRDSVLVWQRELREMANPMKEYLNANFNYEFVLSNKKYDGFIEIPEGAIRARFYPRVPDGLEFENSTRQWWHDENNEWISYDNYSNTLEHSRVVWQRDQDEPFLTPECTLNDQYAEIEQVRQAIKVKSGSDSDHALDAMSFGLMGVGANKKHNHYFKDVSGLNEIDVYMVLKLFNVTDPCLQHIAKKALCAGQRGHKDFKKDLQDILDTAKRAVEINN